MLKLSPMAKALLHLAGVFLIRYPLLGLLLPLYLMGLAAISIRKLLFLNFPDSPG